MENENEEDVVDRVQETLRVAVMAKDSDRRTQRKTSTIENNKFCCSTPINAVFTVNTYGG